MIRLLVLNYEFPPLGGGTGVACCQVLRELARDPTLRIDLVTSAPGHRTVRERFAEGITVHRLPVGKWDAHYWRSAELARWTWRCWRYTRALAAERPHDLCHCWAGWPPGLVGYLLRARIPYLIGLRGSDVPGYNARLRILDPLVFRRLSRRVWRGARRLIAVSENLKALARRTSRDVRVDVIRNGVDADFFTPGTPASPFTILFVGRLIERKGLGHLLGAFAELFRREADLRLVLVGEGPERRRLEGYCRRNGLEESVRFRGHVDRSALPEIYREASVFVMPSIEEAMPNALLEAMAAGLPIVSTRTGASELFQDNGLFVERASAVAIREALDCYLLDDALRRTHGENSRTLAVSLSWAAVARSYRQVYEEVLDSSAVARTP